MFSDTDLFNEVLGPIDAAAEASAADDCAPPAIEPQPEPEPAPADPVRDAIRHDRLLVQGRRTRADIRLEDFKGPYAAFWAEFLVNEASADAARAQVLELEGSLGGQLKSLIERVEASDAAVRESNKLIREQNQVLRQQAQQIASMFRDQLTLTEANGVPTLKSHLLAVSGQVTTDTTNALNGLVDEAPPSPASKPRPPLSSAFPMPSPVPPKRTAWALQCSLSSVPLIAWTKP